MLERLPPTSQTEPKGRDRGAGDDGYITTADIAYLLHRHATVICAAILVGVAIAAVYVFTTPPIFTAHAQVLIDVQTPQTLPQRPGEIGITLDTAQVESQLAIMRSDNLATSVVEQLGLAQDLEFVPRSASLFERITGILKRTPAAAQPPELAQRFAVLALQDRLEVRRQGISYAIDIYVRSRDPEKAAKIANALADLYVADQLGTRASAARQGSEWLEDRIDQLRRQMNNATLRAQEFKARRDYRIKDKSERAGDQADNSTNPQATAGPTLEELESTAVTYRRMYESFLQAHTDAVQRRSYPVSNARVITPASRPLGKSHPKPTLTLAVGAILGMLFGVAVALVRQSLDHSVRSRQQIRNTIGLDCVGELPRMSSGALVSRGGLSGARSESDRERRGGTDSYWSSALESLRLRIPMGLVRAQGLAGLRSKGDREHWHEVNDAPFSPFSEALGHMKLRLTMGRRTKSIKTLGITSALAGEGKSTIASNLAALYSLHGSRVVLVDTDVRNSAISRVLAPESEFGLMDILAGDAELARCLVPARASSLMVLPVGSTARRGNAPELFGSERMLEVIQDLATKFDMVVFDLPPLELVKDGLALSPLLDGILVVAEWGETPLPSLAETVDALRQANAHLIGIVVSKVHEPFARNYQHRGRPYLVELKGGSSVRAPAG